MHSLLNPVEVKAGVSSVYQMLNVLLLPESDLIKSDLILDNTTYPSEESSVQSRDNMFNKSIFFSCETWFDNSYPHTNIEM